MIKPKRTVLGDSNLKISVWNPMFGETTIFYIKIWNHPIETIVYKSFFGVPGGDLVILIGICLQDFVQQQVWLGNIALWVPCMVY